MKKVFYYKGILRERDGHALRIYWTPTMISILKTHFPHSTNEECAGILGVSVRSVIRKARELKLTKSALWLRAIWLERMRMAYAAKKKKK